MQLYKHQQRIVDTNPDRILLNWACGTGKSIAALILANNKPGMNVLIICPKSVKAKWQREVKAFGVSRTAQLPVMDHRNKAISEPDAFQVNTAMQRCLAKAISLHGIGLYIYAGEDLPEEAKEDPTDHLKIVSEAENMEDLKQAFTTAYKALKNNPEAIKQLDAAKEQRKKELTEIK